MKGLCGHEHFSQKGHRLKCTQCKSFWDADYIDEKYIYDNEYPEERDHHSEFIGELKTKTLKRWLKQNNIKLGDKSICEIGFGGAYPLSFLYKNNSDTYGVEAAQSNIGHAIELGINESQLFKVETLPELLPNKINLWIFQDSFEHIIEIDSFMNWLCSNSTNDAQILMILPQANSISEKLMGRLWPHKLPDHKFHWSKKGLVNFMKSYSFDLKNDFYPLKYISIGMVLAHITHKLGLKIPIPKVLKNLSFPFNFGEQGLFLGRTKSNELK